ncbi:MAG: sigma-54 dependent transcriptional regulator [Schleiferiaceae bacterium]|nr:sigma-54 dependent transcriptional regulator [Schleiferiaceae bacterium]MDR9441111.1 sigma-54 dependent transcriptional regulator [Schleiferiaceae bacterium]
MSNTQDIKQRFGIIGTSEGLERALQKALQVAGTDISVLVSGESGVGKEAIPRIIHSQSHRKHNKYIAVNCGAIPEGTIDSELFGHEKGSFTGATGARKGYFEEADGGTIFLDEVGELPLATQVRLLRVLETGEFIKVGSSRSLKTDVRICAATNVNLLEAIQKGKFREDLYYRLNTVEIPLPPLRERKEDIHLLFRKFASDFADKYRVPPIRLSEEAVQLLKRYHWPGNIRQLRNLAEQLSVIEHEKAIEADTLMAYLPDVPKSSLPALYKHEGGSSGQGGDFANEREILYKVLFDMRKDIADLKKLTSELMHNGEPDQQWKENHSHLLERLNQNERPEKLLPSHPPETSPEEDTDPYLPLYSEPEEGTPATPPQHEPRTVEYENLSLQEKEIELIQKALDRNHNKRKDAAQDLGISERTLYRKIKQYNL